MPATSDIDVNMHNPYPPSSAEGVLSPVIASEPTFDSASAVVDADTLFNTNLLGPMKLRRGSTKNSGALQPGLDLLNFDESDQGDSSLQVKGKKIEVTCRPKVTNMH